MPNDLTWTQLNAAFVTPPITVSEGSVIIDTSIVVGDSIASLSDSKVVEFCYKLLLACNKAQIAANVGLTTNLLNSFPNPFYGSVQDPISPTSPPTMDATLQCIATVPLDLNLAAGSVVSS